MRRREVDDVFCLKPIEASHMVSYKIHKGQLGIQDQMIISLGVNKITWKAVYRLFISISQAESCFKSVLRLIDFNIFSDALKSDFRVR